MDGAEVRLIPKGVFYSWVGFLLLLGVQLETQIQVKQVELSHYDPFRQIKKQPTSATAEGVTSLNPSSTASIMCLNWFANLDFFNRMNACRAFDRQP